MCAGDEQIARRMTIHSEGFKVFDSFGGELFAMFFTGRECGRARMGKGKAAYVQCGLETGRRS